MPKKGRRTERDEVLGADPGGFGGDQDYDWIKYLGDGRSSGAPSSPATVAPTAALRTEARPVAAPPSRRYEHDPDPLSGNDTDPRGGASAGRGGRRDRFGGRADADPYADLHASPGRGRSAEVARRDTGGFVAVG